MDLHLALRRYSNNLLAGLALIAMLLSGCASESSKKAARDLTKYKSVCFTQPAPFDQIYMQQVAAAFTKFGFDTNPPKIATNTLVCIMGTKENDTFDMSFVISLWSNGKQLLMVEARDKEVGYRGSMREASNQLVTDAVEKLEKELAKRLKPDSAPQK